MSTPASNEDEKILAKFAQDFSVPILTLNKTREFKFSDSTTTTTQGESTTWIKDSQNPFKIKRQQQSGGFCQNNKNEEGILYCYRKNGNGFEDRQTKKGRTEEKTEIGTVWENRRENFYQFVLPTGTCKVSK